jgi:hypothetical protein
MARYGATGSLVKEAERAAGAMSGSPTPLGDAIKPLTQLDDMRGH